MISKRKKRGYAASVAQGSGGAPPKSPWQGPAGAPRAALAPPEAPLRVFIGDIWLKKPKFSMYANRPKMLLLFMFFWRKTGSGYNLCTPRFYK